MESGALADPTDVEQMKSAQWTSAADDLIVARTLSAEIHSGNHDCSSISSPTMTYRDMRITSTGTVAVTLDAWYGTDIDEGVKSDNHRVTGWRTGCSQRSNASERAGPPLQNAAEYEISL